MEELDLIGSGEAAELLKVHRTTLFKWAKEGVVPVAGRTPGGKLKFDRKVILELRRRFYSGG